VARVLVTEPLADTGIDALRAAGHEVDVRLGLSPEELLEAVRGAHALVIRSATRVTPEVLEAGSDLVVVGRAGIGVDNVDVEAATRRGVMVVNAPQSNMLSTAEHTIALLLALARNVPQAHGALVDGRWEKSRWEGVELHDKTLGIIGLGRIGKLVAQRAHAFGMRLVAFDAYVSPDRARQLNVELVDLERLLAVSDFVCIHLVKTPETTGLLGKDALAKAKPGIRIINTARGGIVDEDALYQALQDGTVAGAALDVFAEEPTTTSPLFELENVVVTPHLASSTSEAQDKAGATIADQVLLALAGEFVPFALNVSASEAAEAVRPFLPLAERLGRFYAGLSGGSPPVIEVEYQGQLADYDTRIVTLSVLKGLFAGSTEEPVSYVNAPQIAAERGVQVRETTTATSHDYVNLVTLRSGHHAIAGTLSGLRGEPRIVMVDDHAVEVPPSPHMLVVRNEDVPLMIAKVTTAIGEAGINIADMDVGQSPEGAAALMVLSTDQPVAADLLDRIRQLDGVQWAHAVELG
jgi:D-3-phosphoglycerate dehydrogenase / 2-oxoglutarate reductase